MNFKYKNIFYWEFWKLRIDFKPILKSVWLILDDEREIDGENSIGISDLFRIWIEALLHPYYSYKMMYFAKENIIFNWYHLYCYILFYSKIISVIICIDFINTFHVFVISENLYFLWMLFLLMFLYFILHSWYILFFFLIFPFYYYKI